MKTKIIVLLIVGIVVFVSGCTYEYDKAYERKRLYFESCFNSPDGYWNSDEQMCESKEEIINELFGENGCIELDYVDSTELIKGKEYLIFVDNQTYSLKDFELYHSENLSDIEYMNVYKIELNTSLCKAWITLRDFNV